LANPLLEVKDLEVFYGGAQAIGDVGFKVKKGTIVALVGSNGAGKTTILKTISGLVHPYRGEITFMGRSLNRLKPEEMVSRGITHVPEGRRLFSKLTVLENLELGAFLQKNPSQRDESLEEVFSLFPKLKERVRQPASSLSGGEQQMLAIGRAIMGRPTLLLLDEPSLGLAPLVVKLMFETVQTLNQKGMTIILVEQNVYQTLQIADYVYVLQTGKLVLEGLGTELLSNSEFQKAYLGMNP
jgi:branched-chain amino acid transport system ATP-binding protein